MNTETPVDIGEDRQLFVDDFWIADMTGVERVLHSPTLQDIALEPEHPWEVGGLSYLICVSRSGEVSRVVPRGPEAAGFGLQLDNVLCRER